MSDFIDFRTLERPASPNSFLLAPEGLCERAEPDEISQPFGLAPAALFERLGVVLAADRAIRVRASDGHSLRLSAVATTALLRFRDDVDAAVFPAGEAGADAMLAVYSRSRIGYSDLGANARRVHGLVKKLRAQ